MLEEEVGREHVLKMFLCTNSLFWLRLCGLLFPFVFVVCCCWPRRHLNLRNFFILKNLLVSLLDLSCYRSNIHHVMPYFSSIFLFSLRPHLSSHCMKNKKSFPLAYLPFSLTPWHQNAFCEHLNKIPAKDSSLYKSNSTASYLGDNIFRPYYTISKESATRA